MDLVTQGWEKGKRKQLELSHGDGMPKECWPFWLLYRISGSEERNRLRSQMTESLESQSEDFELYHHCYHLKAPGGNVPGILLSNINNVMQSVHFRGA